MDNTRREKIVHKCDFCDYENSKKHYLVKHVKRVHFGVRPFKCDLCEFTSADKLGFQVDGTFILLSLKIKILNKKGLNKHISRVHIKRRDFKCSLCEYTTTDKQYLKTHMKTHETEETCTKRYQCDICDKKFHHPCHLRNRAYGKLLADNLN